MEYFPSDYDKQLSKFFQKRRIALSLIEKFGLSMPYISHKFRYDELLIEYIAKDLSNTETTYLMEGVTSLIECLREVQKRPKFTQEQAYKFVYEQNKEYVDKFLNTKDHDNIQNWVNDRSELVFETETSSRKVTEEVLIQELSEFKVRLGRVNVTVVIDEDVIDFKDKNKMEQLTISLKEIKENPLPHIFINTEAYLLFEDLHSIFKNTKTQGADYGFIYWKMLNDGLILKEFKPEKFRKWISNEKYDIQTSSPFRTLPNCSTQLKIDLYKTIKTIR